MRTIFSISNLALWGTHRSGFRHTIPWLCILIFLASGAPARGQGEIFSDGFESCDVSSWSSSTGAVPFLALELITPSPGFVTTVDTLEVSGRADGCGVEVMVNGVPAVVADGMFSATVPLSEGLERITAVASNLFGTVRSVSVSGRRDTDPPTVVFESPPPHSQVTLPSITLAGSVNDIIPGATINADDVSLSIDGLPVPIDNRAFMLTDVPLALGVNAITAVATDLAGNQSSTTIEILREEDTTGIHFEIVGGNNQSATFETPLPLPLTVRALDADGLPIPDFDVDFTVVHGDGLLEDPADGLRRVTRTTDVNGEASVSFRLGRRSGEGAHRVRAGAAASFTFVDFCHSATAGAAVKMSITHDPPTRGVAGQALSSPLSVAVADARGNPVSGVPVTFEVEVGEGNFAGETSQVVATNLDGIAEAFWTLGDPGLAFRNTALVSSPASPEPLRFTAFGYVETGDPSTISGQVFDNLGAPIEGVQVVVRGTALETSTDATGQFLLSGVVPGFARVGLLGSTANDPMADLYYADIFFDVEILSGVDNPLDNAVTLPFVDQANAQLVGGAMDVTLSMEGMPGFEVTVFANSVVLPDGTRGEITMSSSQVKYDKLPMLPPLGTAPRAVATLQPGGITFDPPAQVSYPNTSGLAPGDEADTFFFHSQLGQFVNAGPATVSDDGDRVVSDPGFGLTQSGWHCLVTVAGDPAVCKNTGNGCSVDFSWRQLAPPVANGTQFPTSICPGKRIRMTATFRTCGGANLGFTGQWTTDFPPPPPPPPPPPVPVVVTPVGMDTTSPGQGTGKTSAELNVNGSATGTARVTSNTFTFDGGATCELQFDITVKPGGPTCQAQLTGGPPTSSFQPRSRVRANGTLDVSGCEIRIANRTAQADPFGKFILPDIPTLLRAGWEPITEKHRVRALCPNGDTGQSDFLDFSAGAVIEAGPIVAMDLDPIPQRITVEAPSSDIPAGGMLQLGVTGHYADGSTRDLTAPSEGTTYMASTHWISVDENGLVTNGNTWQRDLSVAVMVLNQGNTTRINLTAKVPDTDGDGLPDIYENDFPGLDANTPDADADIDADGLTNLEEFQRGTHPERADTDGDGLLDGADRDPLRPQIRRTESVKLGELEANDGDRFGTSVAIADALLAVGMPGDDGAAAEAGAVMVFLRDSMDGSWNPSFEVTAGDAAADDSLGTAVALGSDTLLASAINSTGEAGAVYVYEPPPTEGGLDPTWAEVAKLAPAELENGDRFGSSLAMDDDWAAVGAPGDDDLGVDTGAVYVYHRDPQTGWTLHTKLTPPGGQAGDGFGSSVAMTETGLAPTLLVGAPFDDSRGTDAGAAFFFERDTGTDTWSQGFQQFGGDTVAGDNFGNSVAIDWRWAVVGAHFNSHQDTSFSGAAYAYVGFAGGHWYQLGKLMGQDTDDFDLLGTAVALEVRDEIPEVILGASFDVHDGFFSGSAYRFRRNWFEANKLVPSDELNGAELGSAVAIGGRRLIVGAPKAGLDRGAVYIYE